jgi:hypothetical protein
MNTLTAATCRGAWARVSSVTIDQFRHLTLQTSYRHGRSVNTLAPVAVDVRAQRVDAVDHLHAALALRVQRARRAEVAAARLAWPPAVELFSPNPVYFLYRIAQEI